MNQSRLVVATCSAVAAVSGIASAPAQENPAPVREWVELKSYVCSSVEKRDALVAVCDAALIPALNRLGARKVGVFWTNGEVNGGVTNYNTTVFVLAAFPTAEAFAASDRKLLADAAYRQAAAAIFTAPMREPLYDSCSSSLFLAFESCPQVTQVTAAADRVLQLRIYNSYTIERNAKKIEMFEQGGEIGVFRACGMPPVFFGQALAGEKLANLTYMLAFASPAEKEAAWKRFLAHPDWQKLKADPQYKDTANKITNIMLRPSKGSQI